MECFALECIERSGFSMSTELEGKQSKIKRLTLEG